MYAPPPNPTPSHPGIQKPPLRSVSTHETVVPECEGRPTRVPAADRPRPGHLRSENPGRRSRRRKAMIKLMGDKWAVLSTKN